MPQLVSGASSDPLTRSMFVCSCVYPHVGRNSIQSRETGLPTDLLYARGVHWVLASGVSETHPSNSNEFKAVKVWLP